MKIKNLKISSQTGVLLLSTVVLVASSGIGFNVHAKGIKECELESTPIEQLLENDEIKENTTIDEEIANGNINIIEEDNEFRKHAAELTYDNYKNDFDWYVENMRWLKEHYESTVEDIMFAAGKGAVADALEVDMNDVKLRPSISDEPRTSYIEYTKEYPKKEGLKNKSKYLDELIMELTNVQSSNYSFDSAQEIKKAYDRAINKSNDVIMTGINRHNDKLEPKFDKKYIKKKI